MYNDMREKVLFIENSNLVIELSGVKLKERGLLNFFLIKKRKSLDVQECIIDFR